MSKIRYIATIYVHVWVEDSGLLKANKARKIAQSISATIPGEHNAYVGEVKKMPHGSKRKWNFVDGT